MRDDLTCAAFSFDDQSPAQYLITVVWQANRLPLCRTTRFTALQMQYSTQPVGHRRGGL